MKTVTVHAGPHHEFDHVFTLSRTPNIATAWCSGPTYNNPVMLDYAPGHDLGHAPPVSIDAEVDEHGDVHVTGDATSKF